jgi:hypothetical protein
MPATGRGAPTRASVSQTPTRPQHFRRFFVTPSGRPTHDAVGASVARKRLGARSEPQASVVRKRLGARSEPQASVA